MPDISGVLGAVHTLLRPSGRFVASITHPCTDTPFREWERDANRRKRWSCIDRYFERGPIRYTWTRWGDEFTTEAMHATLEGWFTWILDAGFQIRAMREPRPTEEALANRPDLEDATRVPYYILFDLVCASQAGVTWHRDSVHSTMTRTGIYSAGLCGGSQRCRVKRCRTTRVA
jgi:hypothetical protein